MSKCRPFNNVVDPAAVREGEGLGERGGWMSHGERREEKGERTAKVGLRILLTCTWTSLSIVSKTWPPASAHSGSERIIKAQLPRPASPPRSSPSVPRKTCRRHALVTCSVLDASVVYIIFAAVNFLLYAACMREGACKKCAGAKLQGHLLDARLVLHPLAEEQEQGAELLGVGRGADGDDLCEEARPEVAHYVVCAGQGRRVSSRGSQRQGGQGGGGCRALRSTL